MRHALVVGGCVLVVGSLMAPAAGSTVIEPQNLPAGPPPAVAYLDSPSHTIVWLGHPVVHFSNPNIDGLLHVRGGYLIGIQHERDNGDGSFTPTYHEVKFVSTDGSVRRRIAKGERYYTDQATVSRNGRLVAFNSTQTDSGRTSHVITVKKARTGKVVARRDFEGKNWRLHTWVVAMARHRVLLHRQRDRATLWWDLRTNHVHVFDKRASNRPSAPFTYPVPGASLSSHQVAVYAGDHNVVLSIPKDPARKWRTGPHEIVQSWSPDDRRVLTSEILQTIETSYSTTMRIRDARTGAVLATFQGWFEVEPQAHHSPVWESSDALLMTAYSQLIVDEDDTYSEHRAMVRCRVSLGTCETAGPPVQVAVRRSS